MSAVLDASVFVAAVSPNERHHEQALALFQRHPEEMPFLVPTLFRLEVVSAFARRGESEEFLEIVDALARGPRFHAISVDALIDEATELAQQAGLRAYDAVYAALARVHGAELLTLDEDLVRRVRRTRPDVQVRSSVEDPP
jgi:predicted nucleic acid-binding protein